MNTEKKDNSSQAMQSPFFLNKYIYCSAIAHGHVTSFIQPFNLDSYQRLSRELQSLNPYTGIEPFFSLVLRSSFLILSRNRATLAL
jgi:hypothetical protein